MNTRLTTVIVACALLAGVVGTVHGQTDATPGQCYATTGGSTGQFLVINTGTGAADVAMLTGAGGHPGLAIDSQGRIFASGRGTVNDVNLYRIDAATGTATSVGTMATDMSALAFDSSDRLFGASNGSILSLDEIRYYEIDPADGSTIQELGPMPGNVAGLSFNSSDVLFGTAGRFPVDDGNPPAEIKPDEIGTVNLATGAENVLGSLSTGIDGTPDLEFDYAGNLYVIKGGGGAGAFYLYSVNQSTWAGSLLGEIGYPASGFACDRRDPVVEPPSAKVLICHKGMTLEISEDGVPDHFAHGDNVEGPCDEGDSGPGHGQDQAGKAEVAVPDAFSVSQNYPNPFNPTTSISFALPEAASVRLAVFNALGQEVKVLVSATLEAGTHSATWNATDHSGQRVSTGLYFYRITAGDYVETRKMLLLE